MPPDIVKRIEILDRAITKAKTNGFDSTDLAAFFNSVDVERGRAYLKSAMAAAPHSLIFRHDFARAIWGDTDYLRHLAIMVIQVDPIYYLDKFV